MPLGPIQYLPQQPNPFDIAAKGLQLGETIRGIREKRAVSEQAAERKAQYSADLQSTFDDPTPSNIAILTAKYPGQREAFKQSFGVLSEEQKKNEILKTGQVYSALSSGNTDVAMSLVDEQIEASRNSGKDTTKLESIRNYITKDPKGAAGYTGLVLSSVMGEEDFAKTFETIGKERREEALQPAKVTEGMSKAQSAAVKANFAESEAAVDLAKKGWDIAKIQNDIEVSRDNKKIAAAKSALDKETRELKRRELTAKIDKMDVDRDTKVREKTALASSARTNLDNLLNTADMINNIDPNVLDNITGALDASMLSPTIREDSVEAEKLFETLKAQMFLVGAEKMKGLGTLTEMEGKKLENSYQNVDLAQSRETLIKNIKEIQRLALKNRANIATRYGVPDTLPDTPAAELTTPEIDALLLKYGE